MSHSTRAIESSDSVYTFSFTTDWFHTVNAVAEATAPARAARRRGSRAGTHARIQRSLTRNQHPAAIALVTAASRLIRMAYPAASGSRPHTWAISTNRGLPGGCGMPSAYAAAMYSDVSQNWVVGASVNTYRTRAPRDTSPAQRYGGRSGVTLAYDVCGSVMLARSGISCRWRARPGGAHMSCWPGSHPAARSPAWRAPDRSRAAPRPSYRMRRHIPAGRSATGRPPSRAAAAGRPSHRRGTPRTEVRRTAARSRTRALPGAARSRSAPRAGARGGAPDLRRPDRERDRAGPRNCPWT